jgi:hypothetical protein
VTVKLRILRKFQETYSQIGRRPSLFVIGIGNLVEIFLIKTQFYSSSKSLSRFLKSNTFKFGFSSLESSSESALEVLFLATKKDFDVLQTAITFSLKSTHNFINVRVTVVVPDKHLDECENLLGTKNLNVKIIPESSLINSEDSALVHKTFGSRSGWVLQQLVKVAFVLNSDSNGVLVVDADTVLLEPRQWIDSSNRQILTPTWEYHRPYYQFLESLGIGGFRPEYTFVSHHMLMQPSILKELFNYVGWRSTTDIVKLIITIQSDEEASLFSIDYELYAQYLYNFHPDKVILAKWSNKAISLNRGERSTEFITNKIARYSGRFASLSFHSYL